jgi:hypothetical protein
MKLTPEADGAVHGAIDFAVQGAAPEACRKVIVARDWRRASTFVPGGGAASVRIMQIEADRAVMAEVGMPLEDDQPGAAHDPAAAPAAAPVPSAPRV